VPEKPRLAIQLAAEAMEEHPDGVWLVELAGFVEAKRLLPHPKGSATRSYADRAPLANLVSSSRTLPSSNSTCALDRVWV
jgi:hypothetical protein